LKDSFVSLRNVTFHRGERLIFENINIDVPRGKIVGIMGPSGAGKTTLLSLIGGALKPEKGIIRFDNSIINKLSQKALYTIRQKMGFLFQSGALFTDLSSFENVAFPLREHTQLPEMMIRDIVLMKLEAVGLRGARYLMPNELSGGMARRVALARAIVLDPQLILYDEPFVGLDPIALGVIIKLIADLNEALGITSIIVSHDRHETIALANYIYILAGGKVIGEGSPKDLMHSHDPQVKQFMQGLPDGVVPFHYPAPPFLNDLFS
jgi:phospholipid/cholesterol/gamma-HCH transport system ATP-binding protein